MVVFKATMARRRNREPDPTQVIGSIIGLAMVLSVLSPQVRGLIILIPVIAAVGFGIFIFVAVVLHFTRDPKAQPDASPSLQKWPQSLAQPILVRTKQPARFTADLLAQLEWRRFEILVTLYFQKTGQEARRSRAGADGGVDIFISELGQAKPQACVQCKAWNTYDVGVKPLRELFGVMAADSIPSGYFVTSGEFSSEATAFARGKPLVLMDGKQFLEKLNSLPETDRAAIMEEVTSGDYTTPTCPSCDTKMVRREGSRGAFWGCQSFPKCRQTFKISTGH